MGQNKNFVSFFIYVYKKILVTQKLFLYVVPLNLQFSTEIIILKKYLK